MIQCCYEGHKWTSKRGVIVETEKDILEELTDGKSQLAKLRIEKRMTQNKLSKKTGIARSTIAALEAEGPRDVKLKTALTIGEALGVTDTKTLRDIFLS
jgi:DNA-binding XRE family transcriptional regulator